MFFFDVGIKARGQVEKCEEVSWDLVLELMLYHICFILLAKPSYVVKCKVKGQGNTFCSPQREALQSLIKKDGNTGRGEELGPVLCSTMYACMHVCICSYMYKQNVWACA